MLLTEQDREFINKLHHELIRHIFMYHQFTKQEPGDLRSFLFKQQMLYLNIHLAIVNK
jgi:hypothetical protein